MLKVLPFSNVSNGMTPELHPDLVPYEHLTEEVKRFDVESAKAIIAELIRLGILRQ